MSKSIIILLVLFSPLVAFSSDELDCANLSKTREAINCLQKEMMKLELPVGTIVSSLLPPELFNARVDGPKSFDPQKTVWILADGQTNISGSKLHKLTNKEKTPDLRAMFLRGMSDRRTDNFADPEGLKRDVGSQQSSMTALPQNMFKGVATETSIGRQYSVEPGVEGHSFGYGNHPLKVGGDGQSPRPHSHGVLINEGGDIETRPNNVAVFFYIKIN